MEKIESVCCYECGETDVSYSPDTGDVGSVEEELE